MHDQQIFKDGDEYYVWIYDPVPLKTFFIGLLLGMFLFDNLNVSVLDARLCTICLPDKMSKHSLFCRFFFEIVCSQIITLNV